MLSLLIFAAATTGLLLDEQYGDWDVKSYDSGLTIAGTFNDGGAIFGTLCTSQKCSAFINPQIECEDGHQYPALVNAPSAAFSVTLYCEKIGKSFYLSTPLDGGITDAMSVGGVLGVAFPMQSGKFQVGRFSLTGAAMATARAMQIAEIHKSGKPAERSNDNYKL